LIRNFSSPSKS